MNIPRKHHYVPKLLLKNFTLGGRADDRIWVFDQGARRQWPSTPGKSACEANFNTTNADRNAHPMVVEEGFGRFESDFAAVLRNIIASKTLPADSRGFDLLVNFIALSISRVPAIRDKISGFFDEVRAKEEFARERLRRSGKMVLETPAEEIDQTWMVENTILSISTLVPHLAQRKWSLWFAEDDAPDLICSDNPVALNWTARGAGPWPPGFGLRNTLVSFPLTRRILLVGTYEGQQDAVPLNERAIATANACTAQNANQLYSAAEDFVWLMDDGRIGSKDDLIMILRAAAAMAAPDATT